MSAIEIDAGTGLAASTGGGDEISRRLESLPASSYVWRLVILLSLGGCFEIYDLFLTGYIAPGRISLNWCHAGCGAAPSPSIRP
jgi:putative MFS transporter